MDKDEQIKALQAEVERLTEQRRTNNLAWIECHLAWAHKAEAAEAKAEGMQATLERIADGRLGNAPHNGHCLCHRCAMPPGMLREMAARELAAGEAQQ